MSASADSTGGGLWLAAAARAAASAFRSTHFSVNCVSNAPMELRLAHRVVRQDAAEPAVVRVDPAPRRAGVAPHEREVAGL